MEPLIEKYLVKHTDEIIGQDEAVEDLRDYILNYKKQKKKAAMLHGPPGTGKTSSVHAVAKESNLEVIELNAGDIRNKKNIKEMLGNALNQQSLFSKGKVILMDEIGGLSGRKDRGGLSTLKKLMKKSSFPIIMTINNPWDYKYSSLRRKTKMIEFEELDYKAVVKILKKICANETIKYDDYALRVLARRSGGDVRAAINDIQILGSGKEITSDDVDFLSEREKEDNIINALTKIFKTTNPEISMDAFDYIREDVDKQFLWLDKNLPKEYTKPNDLARAYDKLSKADVFRRRIRRWQHWRFLVYINALITGGISVSKDEKYKKFVKYKPTGRLLKIYWANRKNKKKKDISAKIADLTHGSTKDIIKDFGFFKVIYKKNKEMADKITEELELDSKEVKFLKK